PPVSSTLSLHDALPISLSCVGGLRSVPLALQRSSRASRIADETRSPTEAGRTPRPRLPESVRSRAGRRPGSAVDWGGDGLLKPRSEEHTSELQSPYDLV